MKNAVMYGAGNIGRGFVGALFSQSGYHVRFVDVAKPVIDALNKNHCYPVRHVSTEGYDEVIISNVSGIDGTDAELVSDAICHCDLMATAVGVNILKFIVPNIALGLRKRFKRGARPLNIIICENLMDANIIVEKMLKEYLSEEETAVFNETIGLVEASIGRMVPFQTEDMKAGDPLRVCVERYGFLPVDKAAIKGEIPEIRNLVPEKPFDFYIKRKLYVHNMGHAIIAYLGDYTKREYIYETIGDENIKLIVFNAMIESAISLSSYYKKDLGSIIMHVEDLLARFENEALRDTCMRVGNDLKRKLAPSDRLIGSLQMAIRNNVKPVFISLGVAAAVYRYLEESGQPQTGEACRQSLKQLAGLDMDSLESGRIVTFHSLLAEGRTLRDIRAFAEHIRSQEVTGII